MTLNVDSAPDECFGERKRALSWPPGEHPRLESFFEQVRRRIQELPDWIFEGGKPRVESAVVSSGDDTSLSVLVSVNENTTSVKAAASTTDFPTAQDVDDTTAVEVPDGESSVEITDLLDAPFDQTVYISIIAYDERGCPADSVFHLQDKDFACCPGDTTNLFGGGENEPIAYFHFDEDTNPSEEPGSPDESRRVNEIINNNDGFIIKVSGGGFGSKVLGVSGLAYDNASGFGSVRVPSSQAADDMEVLQLDNQTGGTGGFTVLGWFKSNSSLVETASFGQLDNTNEEGWSYSLSGDAESINVDWWDTNGAQQNTGSIDSTLTGAGSGEWIFCGFSISEFDGSKQTVTFWINGKNVAETTVHGGPIEPAVTEADLSWGGDRGDNPNSVRISGQMDECQIYSGVLPEKIVARLYREPGFVKSQFISTMTLDDIPDGDIYSRIGAAWTEEESSDFAEGRPEDFIDKVEIEVDTNDTCAGGGGLDVEATPIYGDNSFDESDYRIFWWVEEDGSLVSGPSSDHDIFGLTGGSIIRSWTDGTTGSDASDAATHIIQFTFSLMRTSTTPHECVGTKTACIRAIYGRTCP